MIIFLIEVKSFQRPAPPPPLGTPTGALPLVRTRWEPLPPAQRLNHNIRHCTIS